VPQQQRTTLGHSLSIAPGRSGPICVFSPFPLKIYDRLETENRPGRGRFGALQCSCTRLPMIQWEKLMVTLVKMVMNINVT